MPTYSPQKQWRWDQQSNDWIRNAQQAQQQQPGMQTGQGGDAFQRGALMDLLTTGGKNLSKISAAKELIAPPPTAAELAKKQKKGESSTAIDLLESIYLGEEGDQPLAFGKKGTGGRLPGIAKGIQTKIAPESFPESVRLNTYKRTLESIRPQLAKAAGDAGNIALAEQIMAGKGLPDEQSTPKEAIALFKSMRGKFDLEPSKRVGGFEKTRLPEIEKTRKEEISGVGGLAVGAGKLLSDILLGSTKGLVKRIKGGEDVYGKDESPLEMALKSMPPIGLTDPEYRRDIAAPGLEILNLLSLPKNIKSAGKAITKPFKAKPAKLGKEVLEEGMELVNKGKGVRTVALQKAQKAGKKVSGTSIVQDVKEWAKRAKLANPTQSGAVDDFAKGISKRIKGKNLTANTAKNLWDDARKGFTNAGKAGNTLEAGYHRTIRDALRKGLEKAAPGFDEGTSLMRQGLEKDKLLKAIRTALEKGEIKGGIKGTPSPILEFLKGTGKKVAGGAATGAGLFGLSKLLGLDISGAFREQR